MANRKLTAGNLSLSHGPVGGERRAVPGGVKGELRARVDLDASGGAASLTYAFSVRAGSGSDEGLELPLLTVLPLKGGAG